jgi:hypothetical protein
MDMSNRNILHPLSFALVGIFFIIILFLESMSLKSIFFINEAQAFGECSEYGPMVRYDSFSNTCECMNGYIMKDSYSGTRCVSANSFCQDDLGFHSRYNSLSNSCECSYGYIIGKDSIGRTQCISEGSLCTNTLGFNSRYNTLTDSCECWSGYVIENGRCVDGGMFCSGNHGINSEYNDFENRCECEDGYTLDDFSQCVEKQNNAYFYLKELDVDSDQAIIKSEHDYEYYLISYGTGCFNFSFERYVDQDIVVNLGTDFSVDKWDRIVLQDDNEVCDITDVSIVDSNMTLFPEESEEFEYIENTVDYNTADANADSSIVTNEVDSDTRSWVVIGVLAGLGGMGWYAVRKKTNNLNNI